MQEWTYDPWVCPWCLIMTSNDVFQFFQFSSFLTGHLWNHLFWVLLFFLHVPFRFHRSIELHTASWCQRFSYLDWNRPVDPYAHLWMYSWEWVPQKWYKAVVRRGPPSLMWTFPLWTFSATFVHRPKVNGWKLRESPGQAACCWETRDSLEVTTCICA